MKNKISLSNLSAIIVTLDPDIEILKKLIISISKKIKIIIVDNNSEKKLKNEIILIARKENAEIITNEKNIGLASALNQGSEKAHELGHSMVLLLDQDSEPSRGSIEILIDTYISLSKSGVPIGGVGPKLLDVSTGIEHGFHCIKGWKWTRIYTSDSKIPIKVSSLNGSGTLMSLQLFTELRGLDDKFFIDHVDTEWSFRVIDAGYCLYGVPEAVFMHRMGDKSLRFWLFGWKVWPWRSPVRHRYLFRNAVILIGRDYVPFIWKFWVVIKLLSTILVHLVLDPQRGKQILNMSLGLKDGVNDFLKRS